MAEMNVGAVLTPPELGQAVPGSAEPTFRMMGTGTGNDGRDARAGILLDPCNGKPATAYGNKSFAAFSVGTEARMLLDVNCDRIVALFTNIGPSAVWLGADETVTPETGIPLAAGFERCDDRTRDAWYAVTASGTADLRVMEATTPW